MTCNLELDIMTLKLESEHSENVGLHHIEVAN